MEERNILILNEAEEQRLDLESQISRLASENNLVSSPVSVNSFSRALLFDVSEFVRLERLHHLQWLFTWVLIHVISIKFLISLANPIK